MSPEPEPVPAAPSAAEAALQSALRAPTPEDGNLITHDQRQERLRQASRLNTTAHDLSQFLVFDIVRAMGKVIVVLWKLVTIPADPANREASPTQDDDDKSH